MGTYIEIELTKKELELLETYNKNNKQEFEISSPKICIENNNKYKNIFICPNEGYWGIMVYRTNRKREISEHEAHQKTMKLLKIFNGLRGL